MLCVSVEFCARFPVKKLSVLSQWLYTWNTCFHKIDNDCSLGWKFWLSQRIFQYVIFSCYFEHDSGENGNIGKYGLLGRGMPTTATFFKFTELLLNAS